jgi:hypothetical protein
MKALESPVSSSITPQFIRFPRSGQLEPYSGLRRTQLDRLVRPQADNGYSPPVRSHILRAKGCERGVRLIDLQSLLEYISGLPGDQPRKKRGRGRGT